MAADRRIDEHDETYPGAHARVPGQIPLRGWWQVVLRAGRRAGADRVPLLAAGVAFFAFLAIFPTLIAAILVYGLVSDPDTISDQVEAMRDVLPDEAVGLVSGQMEQLVEADPQGLSLGLLLSVLVALWTASLGVHHLISAVNLAYEEDERVGVVKRRLMAMVFTVGAIVVFLVLVSLVAVFPAVFDAGGLMGMLLPVVRWVVLLAVFTLALGFVYRYAPERAHAQVPWVSVGAVVATGIWLLASVGFSLYVTHFGNYAQTYGTLAGVAVAMLWLWFTSLAVLFGAEVNAEAEHQTDVDTTTGEEKPRGQRDAVKADAAIGRPLPDDD